MLVNMSTFLVGVGVVVGVGRSGRAVCRYRCVGVCQAVCRCGCVVCEAVCRCGCDLTR